MKKKPAYVVEVDNRGCANCGSGRMWDVIGPDGVALSTSYGGDDGEESAHDMADELNSAYRTGLYAAVSKGGDAVLRMALGDVLRLKRLLGLIEGICSNPDAAACGMVLALIKKELKHER